MRKQILLVLMSVIFAGCSCSVIGCTSPTLPSAQRDLQIASQQFNTITFDLAVRAKYNAMLRALDVIKTAEDPAAREKALIEMSDLYQEVEYLLVQAERAQSLLRSGREWVREQRGVFDVVVEEAKEAKARADAKTAPTITTTPLGLPVYNKAPQ